MQYEPMQKSASWKKGSWKKVYAARWRKERTSRSVIERLLRLRIFSGNTMKKRM